RRRSRKPPLAVPRRMSALPSRCRESRRSDHLLQAADLPLVAFPLSRYHPTICVVDYLLLVRGFGGDGGRYQHVCAAVVIPPFHPGVESGALGGFGLRNLDEDLVLLVFVLLGEIASGMSQHPVYIG